MRIEVDEDRVEVRLAWWQKVLGLMRNVCVERSDIEEAHVVENPMREAMSTGMKVGLRLPWVYYVARTLRLDQAFIVRRGLPGLALSLDNGTTLKRVLVTTPEAEQLARRLQDR